MNSPPLKSGIPLRSTNLGEMIDQMVDEDHLDVLVLMGLDELLFDGFCLCGGVAIVNFSPV